MAIYDSLRLEDAQNAAFLDVLVSTNDREADSVVSERHILAGFEELKLEAAKQYATKTGFVPMSYVRIAGDQKTEIAMDLFNIFHERGYNAAIVAEKGVLVALAKGVDGSPEFHEAKITQAFLDNFLK